MPKKLTIGYFRQDVEEMSGRSVLDEAIAGSGRLGVRGTWRSLDKYSPRYCPVLVPDNEGVPVCDPTYPAPRGEEWEIRTYLTVAW